MANGKLFVPLDASAADDAALMRAGDDAELLYYRAWQLAKRTETDGVLELVQLMKYAPKGRRAAVTSLVTVGKLEELGNDRYFLTDWFGWNDSQERIEQKREADRVRKQKGGGKKPPGSGGTTADPPPESARIPSGIQLESGSRAEQSRAEQSISSSECEAVAVAVIDGFGWSRAEVSAEAMADAVAVATELLHLGATPETARERCARWSVVFTVPPSIKAVPGKWPALAPPAAPPAAGPSMSDVLERARALARNRAEVPGYTTDDLADELPAELPADIRLAAMLEFDRLRDTSDPHPPPRRLEAVR